MKLDFTISPDLNDTRLDSIICHIDSSCTRSRAGRLIHHESVLVNNLKKKPGYRVRTGDIITGSISHKNDCHPILPEKISLHILFEDAHIIVINKSANLVVHPAAGNPSGTLVNALLHHCPKIRNTTSDCLRPGIIHRLDKDTSGVMVAAKSRRAFQFLQKEFKYRRVQKKYLALVSGILIQDSGMIDQPIGRHPRHRKIMAVNHQDGKRAITCWQVRQRFHNATFVDIRLKTGRTHQIRVHFYAMDHPLLGDTTYQPRRHRKKQKNFPRQMLHAHQLSFRHPFTGQKMQFTAEIPEDFRQAMSRLENSKP